LDSTPASPTSSAVALPWPTSLVITCCGHSASFHLDFFDAGGSAGDAPGYNWQHERAANEFAANLLMPADLVRRTADRITDINELAAAFDVSRQAMAFRLAALGLRPGPLT
jgi:hypothetical protein